MIFGTAIFPKLHKRSKATAKEEVQQHLIKPHELAKAELESLKFEKSLLQHAIAKIYEAVQDGRIDATERDRLLLKYKHQLATYNEKIEALLPLVDFSELRDMRDDVVDLLENRITAIDKRLNELSKKSRLSHKGFAFDSKGTTGNTLQITEKNRRKQGQGLAEGDEETRENETGAQPLTEDKYYASYIQHASEQEHDDKKQYHIPYRRESTSEYTSEEKDIERLQHEIMEALSRLEQTGINNDNEYESGKGTSNNNDKGNNFVTTQYTDITSETRDKSCLRQLIKD